MDAFNGRMRRLLDTLDMDLAELARWGPLSDEMFHRIMAGDDDWLHAVATQLGITVGRAAASRGGETVACARDLAEAMGAAVRPMYLSGVHLGLRLHEEAAEPED